MDIKNVTDFFRKKGVYTLSERSAFNFITADNASLDRDEMLNTIESLVQEDQATVEGGEVDERVFRQAYIPKSLFEVVDPERDTDLVQEGGKDDLIYAKLLDVQEKKSQAPETSSNADEEQSEDSGDERETDEEDEESEEEVDKPRGKRHEDKDAKKVPPSIEFSSNCKERKQKVKEEARERRKNKIPKAEKKRKVKLTARKGK